MGFFSLTGGSQRSDVRKGYKQANAFLDPGLCRSQGYYDQAGGQLDPFVQQGGQAATMYARSARPQWG